MARVRMFRNLHRNAFSVQLRLIPHNGWRTVAWCEDALLSDVQLRVNSAGRARVLASGVKGVHAFVEGRLLEWGDVTLRPSLDGHEHTLPPQGMGVPPPTRGNVRYSPWEESHFMHDGCPLFEVDLVLMRGGRNVMVVGAPETA